VLARDPFRNTGGGSAQLFDSTEFIKMLMIKEKLREELVLAQFVLFPTKF